MLGTSRKSFIGRVLGKDGPVSSSQVLPGDIIMTGTPAGVGAVGAGERFCGRVYGSDKALAEFSVYYSKEMKNQVLQQLSGKIKNVCISYEPIESYFPYLGAGLINKMTDIISDSWDEMLSFCEICPNRCISEKDSYCALFDDKFLFE